MSLPSRSAPPAGRTLVGMRCSRCRLRSRPCGFQPTANPPSLRVRACVVLLVVMVSGFAIRFGGCAAKPPIVDWRRLNHNPNFLTRTKVPHRAQCSWLSGVGSVRDSLGIYLIRHWSRRAVIPAQSRTWERPEGNLSSLSVFRLYRLRKMRGRLPGKKPSPIVGGVSP
jgi:hypothetical protein